MVVDCSHGPMESPRPTKRKQSYAMPLYRVALVRERRAESVPARISNSVTAGAALKPLFQRLDREQFVVCGLDSKHGIIGSNIVSIGSLTLAIVHPREVFKPLILMNAGAWMCAHNHPSGDTVPSPEDRVLTKRLREAGELMGISLLDHLIFGHDRMFSFADEGWP